MSQYKSKHALPTPVYDFVRNYATSNTVRLHMPGHKGHTFLGCEPLDITEITGADNLFQAEGILAQSEANATALFGSRHTFFSTEGASHCIRAMIALALLYRRPNCRRTLLAARNVHRSFLSAAALLDFETEWITPSEQDLSVCRCEVSAQKLAQILDAMSAPPAGVYITSPDYLGNRQDIRALSDVCHRHNTLLLVDNAHGAYLHFLQPAQHPLDLGADLCCDSAHKTLCALTGGAYLHLSAALPDCFESAAREMLALFGSTSPSYLTLASLDRCNAYLFKQYPQRLAKTVDAIKQLRDKLYQNGHTVLLSDPLRLVLRAGQTQTGYGLAALLRRAEIECEYADRLYLVCMLTPENTKCDLRRLSNALGTAIPCQTPSAPVSVPCGKRVLSAREALLAPQQTLQTQNAVGRICGIPTVCCPPAVPIVLCGEEITAHAVEALLYYGIHTVRVVR